METLNQQLKNFRLERKLSQRALAARLGCSHSYIGRMENGHSKIRPCILTSYKLIGFKEQTQDNNTTFTDEEFRELQEFQDKQKQINNALSEDTFNHELRLLRVERHLKLTNDNDNNAEDDNPIFKDLPIKFKNIVTHEHLLTSILCIIGLAATLYVMFVTQ